MRCMSCLENFPRRDIFICNGCKAKYCRECHQDHEPCNTPKEVKTDDKIDDITVKEVDESKPGVWIMKNPEAEKGEFDFWKYVA